MMPASVHEKICRLQQAIVAHNHKHEVDPWMRNSSRLHFESVRNGLVLYYFGQGYDENPDTPANEFADVPGSFAFPALLELLADREVASSVVGLHCDAPDCGANGVSHWDFTRLVRRQGTLPNLIYFSIRGTDLGDHNLQWLSATWRVEDPVSELIELFPAVERLSLPSAPGPAFFERPPANLVRLQVQELTPLETRFIHRLATCKPPPTLQSCDYADYSIINTGRIPATPFADYEELFRSKGLVTLRHLTLRAVALKKNCCLSSA